MARSRPRTRRRIAILLAIVVVGSLTPASASAARSAATFESRLTAALLTRWDSVGTASPRAACMDKVLTAKLRKGRVASSALLERRCDLLDAQVAALTRKGSPKRLARTLLDRDATLARRADDHGHLAVAARRVGGKWRVAIALGRASVHREIVDLTNVERRAARVEALTANACLMANAQRHAEDLAAREVLEHQQLEVPKAECGLTGWVGENALYNFSGSAAESVAQWMRSDGHRTTLLRAEYRIIGVGQARSASGRYYAVQVFAGGAS